MYKIHFHHFAVRYQTQACCRNCINLRHEMLLFVCYHNAVIAIKGLWRENVARSRCIMAWKIRPCGFLPVKFLREATFYRENSARDFFLGVNGVIRIWCFTDNNIHTCTDSLQYLRTFAVHSNIYDGIFFSSVSITLCSCFLAFPSTIVAWCDTVLFYSARSCSFAEYWIRFMARFNGVHAFGYNSAGSEPIWMKFGALWVQCLCRWHWQILARSAQKRQRESEAKFCFFCEVMNIC